MRIFLDVGAHYGETLDVALDPTWAFDRVYSLEPSRDCQELLATFRDERLVLDTRGLSNRNETAELYGAGLLGGSVYADKPQGDHGTTETIQLVRASEWIRQHTSSTDAVYLKLNCEGSEADVLEDLLDSEVLTRIQAIYVDFDIRKIPSQAFRQADLEARLGVAGVPFETPESLGVAGNPAVATWLSRFLEPLPVSPGARLRHDLRWYLPPYLRLKAVARVVLPRSAFMWVGQRLGRQARRA